MWLFVQKFVATPEWQNFLLVVKLAAPDACFVTSVLAAVATECQCRRIAMNVVMRRKVKGEAAKGCDKLVVDHHRLRQGLLIVWKTLSRN